jgi:hypothetical protein
VLAANDQVAAVGLSAYRCALTLSAQRVTVRSLLALAPVSYPPTASTDEKDPVWPAAKYAAGDRGPAGDHARPHLLCSGACGGRLTREAFFTAPIVRRLPLGSFVQAQQMIASPDVERVRADLVLPGDWVQVTTPAYTGYLFSADLTRRRPAVKKSHSGMAYIDLLGVKKRSHPKKQPGASGTKNGPAEQATLEIIEYANGTYTMTAFDGCFTHEYMFRQLALHEVYHHMISSYAGYENKHVRQPQLVARKGNVYTFTCGFDGGDATQELQLTVHKNGTISISSYDCT